MKCLFLLFLSLLLAFLPSAMMAQRITNVSYQTVAHVKSDGTIQDESYRTIGHAKDIPLNWAASTSSSMNEKTLACHFHTRIHLQTI